MLKTYCRSFITASLLAVPFFSTAQSSTQPNIIFILADDLGYGDIGCYGQEKIPTPHIDNLAKEGILLTDFYAGAPVCSPSRGVLLTGKHTGHATIRGNTTLKGGMAGDKNGKKVYRAGLQKGEPTIGTVMQNAGYHTALLGKWHVGGYDSVATPLNFGFSEFSGWLISKPETYTSTYWPTHWFRDGSVQQVKENSEGKKGYYVSELITDDAISYLNSQIKKKVPFFLMVNHSNPHSPLDAPKNNLYDTTNWTVSEKSYAAMISYLDKSVGDIKAFIQQHGLADNTIIIFTSDNGPRSEPSEQLTHIADFFKSSGALRGYKRDLTDGGIRVPMIVWAPKIFKGGTRLNIPGYFADIMPTLASISNTQPQNIESDGVDLYPALKGTTDNWEDRFLYWEFFEKGYTQAVRYGKWKAIIKDGDFRLFNLENDINERHDIASSNEDIVASIKNYLKTARTASPYWPLATETRTK